MGGSFSGWAGWLLGALAALAVAVIGFLLLAPSPETPEAPPAEVASPAPAPDADTAEAPGADAGAASPAPAAQAETETSTGDETEAPAPLAPDFDVVRIRPDGDALVAGRAEPGARITLQVEGETVAEAEADGNANFVAMFTLPPSADDRVMTLEATLADGRVLTALHSVIIEGVALPEVMAEAPGEPARPGTAEPVPSADSAAIADAAPATTPAPSADVTAGLSDAPDAAPDRQPAASLPSATDPDQPGATPDAAGAQDQPDVADPVEGAPPAEPETTPEPAAPRVLLAGPEGISILQDPGPAPPLSIDTIAYDETGEVALAGRGTGDETVRVYLDNAPVRTAKVGPDGRWQVPLPGIDTGVYTLRIDSIAPDGAVSSRVETPFMREEPEVLAAAEARAAEALAEGRMISAVTIQPGNTLWAIAEDRYGEGLQYVRIFEANRDVIRDPDWIYPGQVFTLPEGGE